MRTIFRTVKGEKAYQRYQKAGGLTKGCGLCARRSLKDFKHWRIISNKFPYDRIARTHHMILPKRHVTEKMLTAGEVAELRRIKEGHVHKKYDYILEAAHHMKSIPAHFHLHLIRVKLATK